MAPPVKAELLPPHRLAWLDIEAGDLQKTVERIKKLQDETDQTGGFVGMYL